MQARTAYLHASAYSGCPEIMVEVIIFALWYESAFGPVFTPGKILHKMCSVGSASPSQHVSEQTLVSSFSVPWCSKRARNLGTDTGAASGMKGGVGGEGRTREAVEVGHENDGSSGTKVSTSVGDRSLVHRTTHPMNIGRTCAHFSDGTAL